MEEPEEPYDCDDADPTVYPGAVELCNTRDDDCDGEIDEPDAADCVAGYLDEDGEGYGTEATCRCLLVSSEAVTRNCAYNHLGDVVRDYALPLRAYLSPLNEEPGAPLGFVGDMASWGGTVRGWSCDMAVLDADGDNDEELLLVRDCDADGSDMMVIDAASGEGSELWADPIYRYYPGFGYRSLFSPGDLDGDVSRIFWRGDGSTTDRSSPRFRTPSPTSGAGATPSRSPQTWTATALRSCRSPSRGPVVRRTSWRGRVRWSATRRSARRGESGALTAACRWVSGPGASRRRPSACTGPSTAKLPGPCRFSNPGNRDRPPSLAQGTALVINRRAWESRSIAAAPITESATS